MFQYFAIAPMRSLGRRDGAVAAVKADFASITSWQVGMYGMALLRSAWLRPRHGAIAPVDAPAFRFVMQVAMLAGFCTAFPIDWWLIRSGVKERV